MTGCFSYLTLAVADVDAALDFYRATFGWQTWRKTGPAIFIDVPPITVALMDRSAFTRFVGLESGSLGMAGSLHSWNVASAREVDELVMRAKRAGAVLRREPAALDWGGWAGVLESPDGHLWEIVWNPRRDGRGLSS